MNLWDRKARLLAAIERASTLAWIRECVAGRMDREAFPAFFDFTAERREVCWSTARSPQFRTLA
jgi:hypothetical protein